MMALKSTQPVRASKMQSVQNKAVNGRENSEWTTKDAYSGKIASSYCPEDFEVHAMNENHLPDYMKILLEHFAPREPMGLGLRVSISELKNFLWNNARKWVNSGASVYSVHTPTNEIAGVTFTQIVAKNEEIFSGDSLEDYSKNMQYLIKALDHLESAVNFFEDPKVERFLEIAATSVNPKFSGCRVTYRMTEESEKLAAKLGCQLSVTQSTNAITQHIRRKMGYTPMYDIKYSDFKIDGDDVFDVSKMNGSRGAVVFKKRLS